MKRNSTLAIFGLVTAVAASGALAAPRSMADCRALSDPAARLSCYDMIGMEAPAPSSPPPAAAMDARSVPAASGSVAAPAAPRAAASELKRRSDFDSRVTAVVPQRHGYYRIVLEDGSAYLTTSVAPPIDVGAAVHIRRTFIGTIYLDTAGRDPIAIKPAKVQ